MTVFRFTIYYTSTDDLQVRYVLAETEEEAIDKMEEYRRTARYDGMANFEFSYNPTVELENVIV